MERPPGTQYEYKSGNTALLGIIVEKATGKRLAEYAAEKLWQPLGAEHAALWSTDTKNGLAKAYCCFSTNARDFARIGQLMLDSGKWNGINIIDSAYFAESITPCMVSDVTGNPCNYYGYQWWLVPDRKGVFYARGILGQYIIVIPEQNTVVVRLGEVKSPILKNNTPKLVYDILNWVPNLP
jgi:CubicO group peptidase (beta-lactamase class C family)